MCLFTINLRAARRVFYYSRALLSARLWVLHGTAPIFVVVTIEYDSSVLTRYGVADVVG